MDIKLEDLGGSVSRFLEGWRIVRICPHKISLPEKFGLNVLVLAVCVAIFALARGTVAGADRSISADTVSTIISTFIVFCTGYVAMIFYPADTNQEMTKKWSLFFVMMWITSLIVVILIDGIPAWNHSRPLTSSIINIFFVPGTLSPIIKDLLRGLIIGGIASLVMVAKTRVMDKDFRFFSSCAAATIVLGLVVNAGILLVFLYGNVV